MRRRTRKNLDLLKELLLDDSFDTETQRTHRWMFLTGRSRARYFVYLSIALKEIEEDNEAASEEAA